MSHWTEKLYAFQPCAGGMTWARKFPTAQAAWDSCENPGWMCWLLGKTGANRSYMTLLACELARFSLPYADGDEAELVIAASEQWAHGDEEVTLDDVRRAAADAASYTAYAAAYCAAAASAVERAYAAYAAYYTAAAAGRDTTLRKCCHIIRQFYPEVPL